MTLHRLSMTAWQANERFVIARCAFCMDRYDLVARAPLLVSVGRQVGTRHRRRLSYVL
jgi:hypothetical protein